MIVEGVLAAQRDGFCKVESISFVLLRFNASARKAYTRTSQASSKVPIIFCF